MAHTREDQQLEKWQQEKLDQQRKQREYSSKPTAAFAEPPALPRGQLLQMLLECGSKEEFFTALKLPQPSSSSEEQSSGSLAADVGAVLVSVTAATAAAAAAAAAPPASSSTPAVEGEEDYNDEVCWWSCGLGV